MRAAWLLLLLTLPVFAEEPPMLLLEVREGKLPPMEKRLPQSPLVVKAEALGKYGGTQS